MTVFQQRATTAIIFSIVMLTGLFWNAWSFHLLFLIIATGSVWEFLNMTLPDEPHKTLRKVIGASVGLGIFVLNIAVGEGLSGHSMIPNWPQSASIFPPEIVINLLMSLSFLLLILELFLKATLPFNNVALTLFSVFYLALPFSLLSRFTSYSNTENFTPNVVAGILFLTWANDSFAYLVGSKIGKTPFFLRVSPKKTWEGTIGGGIFCMMTAGIIAQFFTQLGLIDWLIVGGIIAVFGTLGDLVESLLKRSVGVKDSGNFMPGHGGFLDRFDAFIFCIPFVYFYLSFVKYL
jgi:phosphatidate cytidylyltransferase